MVRRRTWRITNKYDESEMSNTLIIVKQKQDPNNTRGNIFQNINLVNLIVNLYFIVLITKNETIKGIDTNLFITSCDYLLLFNNGEKK